MIPRLAYLLCLLLGDGCMYGEAHVTTYAPELGGVNCMEPCDRDAALRPVVYGLTAACDPRLWDARVYIEDVGWRQCRDTGGAIQGLDIDIAIPASECEWVPYEWRGETRLWCHHGFNGERRAIWLLPRRE